MRRAIWSVVISCLWLVGTAFDLAVQSQNDANAAENVTIQEKIEAAYDNGLKNDFALSFLDESLNFEVTNEAHRKTIWKKLSLKIDKTGTDDLYVITPRWAADNGNTYEVGKSSGELIWKTYVGIAEPYQFYLFAPDLGWNPPSGKLHISPQPKMRSFDTVEFQIRMALTGEVNAQGQYDYKHIYDPVAQRAKPGCGPTWIRTERDVLSDTRHGIKDVLFVQLYDADCLVKQEAPVKKQAPPLAGPTEDGPDVASGHTYATALKLQSSERHEFTVAGITSNGRELDKGFVGGRGYHYDKVDDLHLISGPIAVDATVVDLSVKLVKCTEPIVRQVPVDKTLITEDGPDGILNSIFEILRKPITVDVDPCFQLPSVTYYFKDVHDDAQISVPTTVAKEGGYIKAQNVVVPTGEETPAEKGISTHELAFEFERELSNPKFEFAREGYVSDELVFPDFQPGQENAKAFPALTLKARRLVLQLDGTSRAPERVSLVTGGDQISDLERDTDTADGSEPNENASVYIIEETPNFEPKGDPLRVQLPFWLTADKAVGWDPVSGDLSLILETIHKEKLPLLENDPSDHAQPEPLVLKVRPHDKKVEIKGRPVSVTMPIYTADGTFDLASIKGEGRGCVPGLRVENDETLYRLDSSDDGMTWTIPEDFQEVSPKAMLKVVAEAKDPNNSDYNPACDGIEITSEIEAYKILEGETVTVPVKRPVLVYILRAFDRDVYVGATNAEVFWAKLLALVGGAVDDRVYVVRYKSGAGGFRSLQAPTGFAVSPPFDLDRFARETARSRHAPSLDRVVDDAKAIIKQFAREHVDLAADVVVLSSEISRCRNVATSLAELVDPTDDMAPARVLMLGDSDSRDIEPVLVAGDEYTYAADCAEDEGIKKLDIQIDNLDIRIANVKKSLSNDFPHFAEDDWKDALDQLKTP